MNYNSEELKIYIMELLATFTFLREPLRNPPRPSARKKSVFKRRFFEGGMAGVSQRCKDDPQRYAGFHWQLFQDRIIQRE